MKICLIQARDPGDEILEHETYCFERAVRTSAHASTITSLNFAERIITIHDLEPFDILLFGGSGDYSIAKADFEWCEPLLELMRDIVAAKKPTFASCFGFQALVASLGGVVESPTERGEVGTFEIVLTKEGKRDPLFSQMPSKFWAQLGHNDSAIVLPAGVVHLAGSERCPHQALRVIDAPIVATQFHPELEVSDNIVRFLRYLAGYRPNLSPTQAKSEADEIHQQSPFASQLIGMFVDELHGL